MDLSESISLVNARTESDLIRMSFDPRHDHQNAYVFEVNPSGVQNDYIFYDDTRQSPDYDAVWDVRTSITSEGWFAEYMIPFSQMRFTVQGAWGAPVHLIYAVAGAVATSASSRPNAVSPFASSICESTSSSTAAAAGPSSVTRCP